MTEDGSKTEDRSASSRSLSMGAGDRPKRENGSQTDQEASFADDVCQRAGRQRDEEHWQLVATCTSDTINGCVVRLVISHVAPRCTSRYRRWRRRLRSISPQTCGDGMGSTENERTWLVLERP